MHAVGLARQREVAAVIDDEQSAAFPRELAKTVPNGQQLSCRRGFVPQLKDASTAFESGSCHGFVAAGCAFVGDDVEAAQERAKLGRVHAKSVAKMRQTEKSLSGK